MSAFGDLREAIHTHEEREAARILLLARNEEWTRYARDIDPNVLAPERLVRWAEWAGPGGVRLRARRGLWQVGWHDWVLEVAGVPVARPDTVDLVTISHRWATTPARAVLHHWEESAFARRHPDLAPLPRSAIEVKEAWCRGEVADWELADAWATADSVVQRASAAAAAPAARAAAISAREASGWAARAAAGWAAVNSAARADALASGTDVKTELRKWDDVWTAHVLGVALASGGAA